MMTVSDPKEIYLRRWWWSAQPFWKYLDSDLRGWANLVDRHPGLFNLAWCMSGVTSPPAAYEPFAASVGWVFNEAAYIPMDGKTVADWAFILNRADFLASFLSCRRQLKRWRFHDSKVSYESIMCALDASRTSCA